MENNDRMSAWNKFVSTGSVADDLSYSQKKEPQGEINKKKEENKGGRPCDKNGGCR